MSKDPNSVTLDKLRELAKGAKPRSGVRTACVTAGLLAVGYLGGWLLQWWMLPRIGLRALSLGEFAVTFLILLIAHGLIAVLKGFNR